MPLHKNLVAPKSCAADAMFSTQNEPHAEKICYNTIMLDLERLADEYRILSYLFSTAAILRDPRRKPDAFNDFLILREKINEICERTY